MMLSEGLVRTREEMLAADPRSGVVSFTKKVLVRLTELERGGVGRQVGRLLADRRGTYSRDLGGWVVSGLTPVIPCHLKYQFS